MSCHIVAGHAPPEYHGRPKRQPYSPVALSLIRTCEGVIVAVVNFIDKATGEYGWRWVYRDTLAEHGLHDMARHAILKTEDAE